MATSRYTAAWGVDYGNETYTFRSALCEVGDGDLMFVVAGDVDAMLFGTVLVNAGCTTAMQLDINGTWPNFDFFTHGANGSITPHLVDDRMGTNVTRYLKGSRKEFIAFFDTAKVPASSVLDR